MSIITFVFFWVAVAAVSTAAGQNVNWYQSTVQLSIETRTLRPASFINMLGAVELRPDDGAN